MNFTTEKMRIIVFPMLVLGILLVTWYFVPACPMRLVFNVWTEHEQKLIVTAFNGLDPHDIESIAQTLANNDERFFVWGHKVMITPKLFFDKELLWNYTTKSGMPYPDGDYYHDKEYNIWKQK